MEDLAHDFQHNCVGFKRSRLERLHRHMKKFVHQSARHRFDGCLLFRSQRLQSRLCAAQFRLTQLFDGILQIDDHGSNVQRLRLALKAQNFFRDDGLGPLRLACPLIQMRRGNRLQIVDVVEKDTIYAVHLRIDVARYRNVDEEHGPVAALVQELLTMLAPENVLLRAGGGDDDVGLVCRRVEIVKANGLPLKIIRQPHSAIVRSVGHQQRVCALLQQMPRRKLAHLAGADQQDAFAFERTENLLGKVHGNGSNRNRRAADLGFIADLFGNREGRLQQLFEMRLHRTNGASRSIRLFHLSKNLRLSDDHRVEARGDAEEMLHRICLAILVGVWPQRRRIDAEITTQKAEQIGAARLMAGKQFDPITGGENHRLMHPGKFEQSACGIAQPVRRNGQLLSQLHGSRFMIHTCQQNLHGVVNLCTELKWLAAQTQSMMTKSALDRYTAFRPRNPVERRTNSMTRYSTHITKESKTFGSRKYAAPMCSCAMNEPMSRPPVMQ